MLTQNSPLTQEQIREQLKDPGTDYLIIQTQEGMVLVSKKDSTVYILPHDGPPKVLSPGLCN
jgi:hypothetical protein